MLNVHLYCPNVSSLMLPVSLSSNKYNIRRTLDYTINMSMSLNPASDRCHSGSFKKLYRHSLKNFIYVKCFAASALCTLYMYSEIIEYSYQGKMN